MNKKVDEVISELLVELDSHHADYQRHYYSFYGDEDETAKHIHQEKVDLCKLILSRLRNR